MNKPTDANEPSPASAGSHGLSALRESVDRVSREEGYKVLMAEVVALLAENDRLGEAIRRLADQDATLSVCNGNVTVTMDATLTRYERHCIERVRDIYADEDDVACNEIAAVLDGLLDRTK
jgi:hypothetical protein